MAGGRKRTPDHLKVLSGTAQKCRMNEDAPAAKTGIASAPAWLSERAAEHFSRLSAILDGMGIASPDDIDMLAALSSRLEEIEILTATIEDAGRVYEQRDEKGEVKMIRARPEVAMRNEALRHAQSLLAEFGLSPAARSKVSAGGKGEENPFSALDRAG